MNLVGSKFLFQGPLCSVTVVQLLRSEQHNTRAPEALYTYWC